MKNLLCALSILTVCTASNLTGIYIFDSLTILSNRSVQLVLKTEESNNGTDNETVDTVLQTVVNGKNLNQIVDMLFENQLDMINFTYPGVFLQEGDNEFEELNTKHLKNEESLPRNEETIYISSTMENLNDLEKNDKLQTLIKIQDSLVKNVKDVIKSTLTDVLLNLIKDFADKQAMLRMIDEIASVLKQTSDLMQIKHDAKTADFLNGITKTGNEIQSKLLKLYFEARVIYEDVYFSKVLQNSQNKNTLIEISTSIFDGLDELKEKSKKIKKKKNKIYHDSAWTRRPSKMATYLDKNAINANGIPKDIKDSFAEVYGLPKYGKKNVDVAGTQGKETITNGLKRKNARFAKNYGLQKKKMRYFPGELKGREDYLIAPSQRGMFDYFGSESRDTEMEDIDEVSKNVIEAILEGIDDVIPPSNGEYETLRYKQPILTKDPFFEEVLKDESNMDTEQM